MIDIPDYTCKTKKKTVFLTKKKNIFSITTLSTGYA